MAHFARNNAPAAQPAPAQPHSKPCTMATKKPAVPDGYKFCPSCNQSLPHREFSKSNTTKDGYASSCRHCYAYYRKHHVMPNGKVEKKRDPLHGVVPPRTFCRLEPYVPNDTTFYRNTGNKHIPSRGV